MCECVSYCAKIKSATSTIEFIFILKKSLTLMLEDVLGKFTVHFFPIFKRFAVSPFCSATNERICPREQYLEEHFRIFIDLPGEG